MESEHEYKYDGFISYRHLELDSAVAQKLQQLLERYRPPRNLKDAKGHRIKVFRDSTELPTSGDLNDSLKRALRDSEFLIVALSEKTIESKWCMAEIEEFKASRNGRISNILPVIVSGEPSDVLPKALLSETRERTLEDGTKVTEEVEVEPLCADVRSKSIWSSKRKLKTEFLRIAAPMFKCGYDDLYQRHVRRQRRIATGMIGFFAVLAVILTLLAFAIYNSEQRYENNLVDTYSQQGSTELLLENDQEALAYFGNALNLRSSTPAARSGALLLLQQTKWPYLTNKREGSLSSTSPDDDPYEVTYEDETIVLTNTKRGVSFVLPRPTQFNPAASDRNRELFQKGGPIVKVTEDRAVMRYGDYVYCYDLTGTKAKELRTFDLAELFPEQAERTALEGYGSVWLCDDATLMAIDSGAEVVVLSVDSGIVEAMHTNYAYDLNEVVFAHDKSSYALVYGNHMGYNNENPGGLVQVHSLAGTLLYDGGEKTGCALQGAEYAPDDSVLVAWGSGTLKFVDLVKKTTFAEDLTCSALEGVTFEGNKIVVSDGLGSLFDCAFSEFELRPSEQKSFPASMATWVRSSAAIKAYELADGLSLNLRVGRLELADEAGNVCDEVSLKGIQGFRNMAVSEHSSYVFAWGKGYDLLYRIPYNLKERTLGEATIVHTRGYSVVGVLLLDEGFLVVTGNGRLLYFDSTDSPLSEVMEIGMDGQVQEVAISKNGLAAVLVKGAEFVDPASDYLYSNTYGIELWDLVGVKRFAEFERKNEHKLSDLTFDDSGNLCYAKTSEGSVVWKVDAPDPDAQAVAAIQACSCFDLDENQSVIAKHGVRDEASLGNWDDLLLVNTVAEVESPVIEPTEEQAIIAKANNLLNDEDYGAWVSYYDEVWERIDAEDLEYSFSQVTSLFKNYASAALVTSELTDKAHVGIACYARQVLDELEQDPMAGTTFVTRMSQLLIVTDAYDSIMCSYWKDAVSINLASSSGINTSVAYEYTLIRNIVQGKGEGAFAKAASVVTPELVDKILESTLEGSVKLLVQGDASNAASAFNSYVAELAIQDPTISSEDLGNDMLLALFEVSVFERCSAIKPEVIDEFMENLDYRFGMRITKTSPENRAAGLWINDLVVAVNGHAVCNLPQLIRFQQTTPSAILTVRRGGKTLDLQMPTNWTIAGTFVVE